MSAQQFELSLEVKSAPTASAIKIDQRDWEGIRVDPNSGDIGALAVLNDHSSYHCGMIFIEFQELESIIDIRTQKSDLPPALDSTTFAYISSRWADWILRPGAIKAIFEDEHSRIPANIDYHLRMKYAGNSLPPVKQTRTRGIDVKNRLNRLRAEGGVLHGKAQKEGQLHQYILDHIISSDEALGCSYHRNNPTGVPDIVARINRLE
jgi:hypothetical protein